MRHGSQVWRIRFDQQPLQRQPLCHLAQRIRIAERDDAGQRDIEAEIQASTGGIPVLGEAVDDATYLCGALLSQNAYCILGRAAAMYDQRLAELARGADMATESLALPLQIALVVVVVQTRFADGDELGRRG